jgi:hypothetical protein
MQDGFQVRPRPGVGKDHAGQITAIETAVGHQEGLAEPLQNFTQSRLARFNKLARDEIGVRHLNAALGQQLPGGGFAHAHAACDAKEFHPAPAAPGVGVEAAARMVCYWANCKTR